MYALDLVYFTKCLPLVLMILDVTKYSILSICQCLPAIRITTVLLYLSKCSLLKPVHVSHYSVSKDPKDLCFFSVKGSKCKFYGSEVLVSFIS